MPCPSGQAHELEWKLAVGSNASVLSFLGFLCKGLAPSFSNTKSTPLVSWFPFFCADNTSEDKMRKSKIRNWHAESRVPWISYFECVHFMYIFLCCTAVRGAQFLKPMIS